MKIDVKAGFTLAEVLITLGIIGVVAAITIPALITKYNEITTQTKLKKMFATLLNAEKMAFAEYGEAPESWPTPDQPIAKEWFEKYYLPFLNQANIEHRSKTAKDSYTIYSLNGAVADTQPGGRMLTKFSDGSCMTHVVNNQYYFLVYDVNCSSPPNVLGKDVWDIAEFSWNQKLLENGWANKHEILPKISTYGYQPNRQKLLEDCKKDTHMGGQPNPCFLFFYLDGFKFSKDLHW